MSARRKAAPRVVWVAEDYVRGAYSTGVSRAEVVRYALSAPRPSRGGKRRGKRS